MTEHHTGRQIKRNDLTVQVQHDHTHRRCVDQQIQEMILLPQMQTLVLQLFHHLIENIHDTVGFLLSDAAQTGTEVLFFQQLHTITDNIQRFDDAAIKEEKIQNSYQDKSLYKEEQGRR